MGLYRNHSKAQKRDHGNDPFEVYLIPCGIPPGEQKWNTRTFPREGNNKSTLSLLISDNTTCRTALSSNPHTSPPNSLDMRAKQGAKPLYSHQHQ
jgi:hypothetical protein